MAFFKLSTFLNFGLILLLIAESLTLSGCTKPTSENLRPKVWVSQSTLKRILIEIHLVEAATNMRRNNGQEYEQQKNILFDSIFKYYALTPELLEANLLYYNQQPAAMERVYQDVIDSLVQLQQKLRVEESTDR